MYGPKYNTLTGWRSFYLKGGLEISEHGFNLVGSLGVLAEAGLADDGHSSVVGDFLKGLGEAPQSVFSDGALRREAGDGPLADLDAVEKLLSSHVPDALVGQSLHLGPAAVLEFRRWQNAASDLHEAVADVEAELLDVGVVVEVGFPDEVVDLSLAVGSRPSGGFDHGRRLHVR